VPSVADLAGVLRDPARLDALIARHGAAAVLARAEAEGVDRLIAHARPDLDALAARRREAVLEEALKLDEMRRVCEGLAARGVRAAVIKGGSLAYTHYPQPWCRPRLDLDVLVAPEDRARAAAALDAIGYARAGRIQGEFVNRQDAYEHRGTAGMSHTVDLHWEATNRVFFSQRLPARDLLARAVPAPFAGRGAWQLQPVDSLLVACLHRAAHHTDHIRLIWICDEWRLLRALPAADVDLLLARARDAGVASLCARDLSEARGLLGGGDGALAEAAVAALAGIGAREPARRFLTGPRGRLGDLWLDVRSLPRGRDRLRLIREHVLPPASFVLARGGTPRRAWLPWLYARRFVLGAWRWIRESTSR
jgi:hypothetical protein